MIEKKNKQIMFAACVVLVVNGVYDVVCAACILKERERHALDSSALSSCFDLVSDLHIKMFRNDDDNTEKSMAKNDIARRMLGSHTPLLAAAFYCEQSLVIAMG